eukprot:6709722-Pyramimonas_sp.AAC.1
MMLSESACSERQRRLADNQRNFSGESIWDFGNSRREFGSRLHIPDPESLNEGRISTSSTVEHERKGEEEVAEVGHLPGGPSHRWFCGDGTYQSSILTSERRLALNHIVN